MTTTPETTPAAENEVPPLTRPEMGLMGVAAVAAAGVGGLGLASSFDAVSDAAARWDFSSPWMLPVGIDLAIPVFTAANLLLIRMDMPLAWVRFVPWVLTLVTCWLNVAAGTSLSAKVAHGTMPLLWVVFAEIIAHVYAVRIGAATGRRMEKIRRSRWLLAFPSTFVLWRRMTLWEITSYSDALARERERQLARADLRERHGRMWRSKTPRRERVLLKLGELDPTNPPAADSEPELVPAPETSPQPEPKAKPSRPRRRTSAAKAKRTPEEILAEAREATAGWKDAELTADRIRTAVRVSQANARTLRDTLKTERTNRPLHTVDTEPVTEHDDGEGSGTVAA
ncbi:DUF2637 domain-containing protein [Streptomyces niveus]|uniref:DUF2637 domain-containing protein n=1 Tax=Streptomyces niveus TaxID=193462 RepID=UPI003866C070